ncbi:MAG: two-component regulator propeller domain-containing protein [Vicinamibacterales bacterium]|nr:two-component regulator propeller domain-containing protein [Vicinamibacterales bacterium]
MSTPPSQHARLDRHESRYRRRAPALVLLACLAVPAVVPAAPTAGQARSGPAEDLAPQRPFHALTRQNTPHLPQNTVSALVEDEQGVMWFGTLDGLASFDGRDMLDEGARAGAPAFGAVYALARRGQGGVYVGGTSGLLARDAHGTWRYLGDGRTIASVAEESPGIIWVVDQQGTLTRVSDDGQAVWERIPLPPGVGSAFSVFVSPAGHVWVATHRAVLRVGQSGTPHLVRMMPQEHRVTALAGDRAGAAWAGTASGSLVRIEASDSPQLIQAACSPGVTVTAVVEDWRQRIWAGCGDGRVSVGPADGPREHWGAEHGMRLDTRVNTLGVDRHGSLWVGLNGFGASRLASERWRHRTRWAGAINPADGEGVFGITATADGGALIAVFNRGIWHWDGNRVTQIGKERGLTENVRCAGTPAPGVLWAGGRYGLYESRQGERFRRVLTLPTGFVTGLRRAPDGVWYALTSVAGLWSRQAGGWAPETAINAQLPHLNVRAAAWLPEGELWLATGAGLAVVRDGRVTTLHRPGEPGTFLGNSVLVLPNGDLWAGGMGGIWVRSAGAWRRLSAHDGLPGRTIYSLALAPDGTVWAGGSAGVGAYKDGSWTRYTRTTGLIEDECTLDGLAVLADGQVLVGTMGSLAVFTPSVPLPPPAPLRVFWRQAPAVARDGIARLPTGVRDVALQWSAPWLAGDSVEYRRRTSDDGAEFTEPSERTEVRMMRLDPGRVTVAVEARLAGLSAGSWTPPVTTTFDVAPYFYETWWARMFAALAFLGLIPIGVRLRTTRLERRQRELQAAVDAAVADVKTLRGLIPICASCKRIRDDHGSWNQLEAYLNQHSGATLSHGICPECMGKLYPDYTDKD